MFDMARLAAEGGKFIVRLPRPASTCRFPSLPRHRVGAHDRLSSSEQGDDPLNRVVNSCSNGYSCRMKRANITSHAGDGEIARATPRRQLASADRELNKATARVLEALSSFAKDVPDYGVTELSRLLGMTKNMTYRALTTLVEQGYLMRAATHSRYQIGYRILELQSPRTVEPDFRTLCRPYLQRMHLLTGESVSLAVRAGDLCVLIDGIETRKPGIWRVRIGDVLPLFGPASGRVMLAFLSNDQVEAYIAQHSPMKYRRTGETITGATIRRQISEIRERGYARIERPSPSPMVSFGFPVRDVDGGLHGVISVGGPPDRADGSIGTHLDALLDLVEELNSRSRLFSANAAGSELH